NQQWAVGIGSYCCARFFVADRSNCDLFWLDLLCIKPCKIAMVAFDGYLFPFCCVIFLRLAGEFLVNFIFDRLCRENTAKSRPMRIRLAKNRAVLAGTVLDEDWRKIDYVNFAFPQFVIKSRKEWSRRFTMQIDVWQNFLRINRCLRRDRHQQQVDPALFQLFMKVNNRRNWISRFRLMCPAHFGRVSAPELADREKSNIAG